MKRVVFFAICTLLLVWCFINPSMAAEKPVMFLDLSWDSIQLQNRIAGYIVEHGYEKKVDYLFSESIPGLMGLERGNVHIYIDGWVDNQPEWWRKAQKAGTVVDLGVNYDRAPQGWYVPTYVIKGDPERGIEPMAPDLEYAEDLPRYWELFKDPEVTDKGRLTNAPLGWKISSIIRAKLKSLGLEKNYVIFEPGSGTALKTEALASYKKGEPILFYYWEPTALMGNYDFTRLKEKTPFSDDLWTEGNGYNCDFPAPVVIKVMNKEFADNNPWLVDFIKKYETTLDLNNIMLAEMTNNELSAQEAALWFLRNYKEVWHKWIPDDRQEVIGKVEDALSKEK